MPYISAVIDVTCKTSVQANPYNAVLFVHLRLVKSYFSLSM